MLKTLLSNNIGTYPCMNLETAVCYTGFIRFYQAKGNYDSSAGPTISMRPPSPPPFFASYHVKKQDKDKKQARDETESFISGRPQILIHSFIDCHHNNN